MTPDTSNIVIALVWIGVMLGVYAVIIFGALRLVKWMSRTIGDAVQASRYKTMQAEGKSPDEIDEVLSEHVLSRHWWVLPVVAVLVVSFILPIAGLFLGAMFAIRLAVQWPNMRKELDERARLRAERIASRQDSPR